MMHNESGDFYFFIFYLTTPFCLMVTQAQAIEPLSFNPWETT
jgi:hypothetical protein